MRIGVIWGLYVGIQTHTLEKKIPSEVTVAPLANPTSWPLTAHVQTPDPQESRNIKKQNRNGNTGTYAVCRNELITSAS